MNEGNLTNSHAKEWFLAILSIIYAVSPIDLIPDIPVVGWIDDFFIGSAGALNLIQVYAGDISSSLAKIVKMIKWLIIIFGVIIILLVLLLGTLIVKLFTT